VLGRWGLAAAFVFALALAFPFRAGAIQFDLGAVTGWLAPLFFVGMIRGLTPRSAFLWATIAATLGYSAVLYWIYVVVHVHGHTSPIIAVAAVGVLAGYVGIHLGGVAAAAAWAEDRAKRWAVLVVPSAWVVAEHLRTFDLFTGFPWAFLGYALHGLPPARVAASVVGVWGLSFALVLAGTLVWMPGRVRWIGLSLLGLAALAAVYASRGLPTEGGAPDPSLQLGVVQANIPQETKWDPNRAMEAFEAHVALTHEAAREGADLVVWPEASAPVFLQVEPEYRRAVSTLARQTGAAILVGGLSVDRTDVGGDLRFHNSVFFVGPDGEFFDRYDKSRLVPFGEYVPLRFLLGFLSGLATGIASSDITPGPGPRAIVLPSLGQDHALAPLICYEVIYPDLVRRVVRAGARVIVNVTNDAWYGRTSAPHQFLAIATMRSAENRLPMVRAANTGISAIVDAGGAVQAATPIFERRELRGTLPSRPAGVTMYTRFGDWVVWGSWGILALAGGISLVRRGGSRGPRDRGRASRSQGARGGAAEASLTSMPSDSVSKS
jgi:apolipoprotein N-acyltransferase